MLLSGVVESFDDQAGKVTDDGNFVGLDRAGSTTASEVKFGIQMVCTLF